MIYCQGQSRAILFSFLQQLIQGAPETLKLYIMSYVKSKSIQLNIQSNL